MLVAAFCSLHDAEVAARFLTDRGVPTKAIGLRRPPPRAGRGGTPRLARPLIYAAFGGVVTGLVGALLWSVLAPDLLTVGWRVAASTLVGASAAGSIGVLAENGLEIPFQSGPAAGQEFGPETGDSAVVAVEESQVRHAAALLRRIGVDRILVGNDLH
ncbi:MAG: hypothetical protein ACRDYF_01185 [Acidimicrobiia bacterium]